MRLFAIGALAFASITQCALPPPPATYHQPIGHVTPSKEGWSVVFSRQWQIDAKDANGQSPVIVNAAVVCHGDNAWRWGIEQNVANFNLAEITITVICPPGPKDANGSRIAAGSYGQRIP